MQESSVIDPIDTAPFTPLDERDELALDAIAKLKQEREAPEALAAEEQKQAKPQNAFDEFDEESAKQLLAYGLGTIQLSVGAIFDVPFEIDDDAGNKWLDRATPMLIKYGPAGLEWFGRYQGEIFFTMATFSLVGGSAVQIRRLQAEKIASQATQPDPQPEAEAEPEEKSNETPTSH